MLNLTVYGYAGNVAAVTTALITTTQLDRSGCPARSHGTVSDYKHRGCRCPDARADHTRHHKRWLAGLLPPGMLDATGSRRRVQALACLGWGYEHLAQQCAVSRTTIAHIATGAAAVLRRSTVEALAEVYERLSMTPGPSRLAASTARNRGWHTVLAWEGVNIDDRAAEPEPEPAPLPRRLDVDEVAVDRAVAGWPVRLTDAEQREAIARLWRNPEVTVAEIAHRVGSNPARVAKLAERRGWRRRDGSGGWLP